MLQTQKFIIALFALFLGVGLGVLLSNTLHVQIPVAEDDTSLTPVVNHEKATEMKTALERLVKHAGELTDQGYSPQLLMKVYPLFIPSDFSGAEAVVGRYEFKDNQLTYTNTEVSDATADDLTDAGLLMLYENFSTRLGTTNEISTFSDMVAQYVEVPAAPVATSTQAIACTMDAKICPDGSAVGRTGPICEFAACPEPPPKDRVTKNCTPEQRNAEACIEIYAPVCASVQVQCITTPCNPVRETFSNDCFACANDLVTSYVEGECRVGE